MVSKGRKKGKDLDPNRIGDTAEVLHMCSIPVSTVVSPCATSTRHDITRDLQFACSVAYPEEVRPCVVVGRVGVRGAL